MSPQQSIRLEAEVGEAYLVRNDSPYRNPRILLTLPSKTASVVPTNYPLYPLIFGHHLLAIPPPVYVRKVAPWGLGAFLPRRKRAYRRHQSCAVPYRSLRACLTVQWSRRRHHDNAFR
jgi:hypothetical protein